MKNDTKSDILLPMENEWLLCPTCRRAGIRSRILRVQSQTQATHLNVWCRKCGETIEVNIERGQCSRSQSP